MSTNVEGQNVSPNDAKPVVRCQLPPMTEQEIWNELTKVVCGRDMSGLMYYKDDLLYGVRLLLKKCSGGNCT